MKTPLLRFSALLYSIVLLVAPSTQVHAVTATCGADPVANTATVLCGNGSCTASEVHLTNPLEVTAGGCEFNLTGRDLFIEKLFQMTGQGFIKVVNARNISVVFPGRLQATGDFYTPNGYIVQGGLISLQATGTIVVDGTGAFDVSGDGGGTVFLLAGGNDSTVAGVPRAAIHFLGGDPVMKGNGMSSFADLGDRFTDGGELTAIAQEGSVIIDGAVSLSGQNGGTGGIVDIQGANNVDIRKQVDVSGGGGGGGEFVLTAGDDIFVRRTVNGDSSVGGGDGGAVSIAGGEDGIGGLKPGGEVRIDGESTIGITLRGSSTDQFAGYGGAFDATSLGLVLLDNVNLRLDAATNFDGDGGYVAIDSSDIEFYRLSPDLDGDIQILGGEISMGSGNEGGDGGGIDFTAGRDLVITGDIKVNGFGSGGDVAGTAGRAITLGGVIESKGGSANGNGDGGYIEFEGGLASDQGSLANLSVAKDILAFGGALSGGGQSITLAACGLSIAPSAKIDGHAGVSLSNLPGGSAIELISRRAMTLGTSSQYLANPGGSITLAHLPGQLPQIGSNVIFNPEHVKRLLTERGPNCPVCGDGFRQIGEICDKGGAADGACCNATCSAFTCPTVTATPTLTASRTPTPSRTATPIATRTPTPTRTATATIVPSTATATPGGGPTGTPNGGPTGVPTSTRTATATAVTTITPTPSVTPTIAPEPSITDTDAPTASVTPSATATATVTATSTPTASVTPNATATAIVTATSTPIIAVTATSVPSPVPTSAVAELRGLENVAAAKSATKCQQAIGKAGIGFLATRLKQLDACTLGMVKCIQTKPDDPGCTEKAKAKCTSLASAGEVARAKLGAALAAKCGTAAVSSADLEGATGLGYEALAVDCAGVLGHEPTNVADVAECIARRYACRAGALYGTQAPRAGEMLRVAGAAPDTCLPDHAGDGEGVGDPVQGKAIHQCAAAITKAASAFLTKKLSSLTKCVDKVFACIQTKPDDDACLAKADIACGKEAAKIAAERAKVGPAIEKKCGGIDFNANLRPPRAANLDALVATLPGADTLATLRGYETALALNHDCASETLLRALAPRAVALLPVFAPSLPATAGCAAP